MDLNDCKTAWQRRPADEPAFSGLGGIPRHLRLLRTSAIRDLQRSEEWARFIFSFLFALVAAGASFAMMHSAAARIAAWLFALALLVDGTTGLVLLIKRYRAPATSTMVEFISREYRQVENHLRFERYSHRIMILLAAVTLVLLFVSPTPLSLRENQLDALGRMAVVTAFLAVAWRRTRTQSPEIRGELERYLRDLEGRVDS
jgi:hypothetical protein